MQAHAESREPAADATAWWSDLGEYLVDAAQRQVLFWDVLRRRGDRYLEHREAGSPAVLQFEHELLIDGRDLERPCNYALMHMAPDPAVPENPLLRPFVVVDPRAGHGPGIGGFKPDSQVGVARAAGHPVYFVTFFPEPVPGQTLGDVAAAEARFIEEVARRHPRAEGKPCLVGNCQAGWAVAALAAVRPDIMGPLLLNGAPLSYWAGVDGKNPMRYAGGLLGGRWLTSLANDLGNGRFDGAHLVANFENLNPSNTLWTKLYHLYANVDDEAERFLDFERWWGGFFLMNAEEIDRIVSELFIGNRLAAGLVETVDGDRIDLRNIRSPIVVFASWGDNITPPQQALNWIFDLYADDDEIVEGDQTIVYVLHEDIGHLGIFVSGRVARTEHAEIFRTLDLIEALPAGLYEMVIEPKVEGMPHADLLPGDFEVRFERRTLDDIRALDDGRRDEEYFQAVDAVSELNDGLYRALLRPWAQAFGTEWLAETLREAHPQRLQRSAWTSHNPLAWTLPWLADAVRAERRPVAAGNPFTEWERTLDRLLVAGLDNFRDLRDRLGEELFKTVYGPEGLGSLFPPAPRHRQRDPARDAANAARHAQLLARVGEGGFTAAVVRAVVAIASDRGALERRSAVLAREIWDRHPRMARLDRPARWRLVREQGLLLHLDREAALAALPAMVPTAEEREEAKQILVEVLMAAPDGSDLAVPAVDELRRIFAEATPAAPGAATPVTRTAAVKAGTPGKRTARKKVASRKKATAKKATAKKAGGRKAAAGGKVAAATKAARRTRGRRGSRSDV